jgi:release factor glutamine methyltransferase
MPEPRTALRVEILSAADTLAAAGVPSPRADAEILAAYLLGVSRTRLGLIPLIDPGTVESYRGLIARRASREPLQYLTGSAPLGAISVQVGPGVFVPRPETEVLVDWALHAIAGVPAPVVVDLFAGSGAIALAIAAARPDAAVHAVERASGALAWARRNAELHVDSGGTPIRLVGGDVFDERLLGDLEGTADLVTANPPYVPDGTPVEPEVGDYDPPEAVFAGPDGLAVIRPLLSVAAALLKPGGRLAIEHDASQGESAPALVAARRLFADVEDHPDLSGRPRFVTATRVTLRS